MRVVWLIGSDGGVKAPETLRLHTQPIPYIYRVVPSEYRYAVGWSGGKVIVLDLYLTDLGPPLKPRFIKKYEDMDQAVAALTIRYGQDNVTPPPWMEDR